MEELKRILWNHEISVEIKIGAGGKKTSDSESTQLNALIIVPLHFL